MKFCGLTRPQDAALGAQLGARFLGVVFAPSPRRVDAEQARSVLADIPTAAHGGPRRVGVFATATVAEIGRQARDAELDVIQLHGDPTAREVAAVREAFGGEVWAARRVADEVPGDLVDLIAVADRILIDSRSGSALGGTGETFSWEIVAPQLERYRDRTSFVVAGGLTPHNVRRAIERLAPGVVDVSSGVERSPGIKDEQLMRAFALAVGATNK